MKFIVQKLGSHPVSVLCYHLSLLMWIGAMLVAVAARADDLVPRPVDPKRYEKLADRSPFAPPSVGPSAVPVATPPPGPSWSDNLTVTSLMQVGSIYTATVLEKDTSLSYMVRSDVENPEHHLMLSSVQWADRPEAITVTVRKGAQFGEVRFDPSAATSGGAATGPPSATMGRPVQPNPTQVFHPPPLPGTPPIRQPGQPPIRQPGQPPGNMVRGRQIIRANPGPAMPVRPMVGRQTGPVRGPTLVKPTNNDDDDDDN